MKGVREHGEAAEVELWRLANGRIAIRAYNECGSSSTEIDFIDILQWLETNRARLREGDLLPADPSENADSSAGPGAGSEADDPGAEMGGRQGRPIS
jgi:hypothetical protein